MTSVNQSLVSRSSSCCCLRLSYLMGGPFCSMLHVKSNGGERTKWRPNLGIKPGPEALCGIHYANA